MKRITWQEAAKVSETYAVIFEREPTAKEYPIHETEDGVLRFEADPIIDMLYKAHKDDVMRAQETTLNLNALAMYGPGKNDPRIRLFYRKLGYSLYGYWEIFHWEANNPRADEYVE